MGLKESVISWYIRQVLIPGMEVIDKPGFITTRTGKTPLRVVLVPEGLAAGIEKAVVKKYGERGRRALYSAGRQFGSIFAALTDMPTIESEDEKGLEKFRLFFTALMGAAYSEKASSSMSVEKKEFVLKAKKYAVCSGTGLGTLLAEGGSAGVISRVFNDDSIECMQSQCCGRGDAECVVECRPRGKSRPHSQPGLDFANQYEGMNRVRKTFYSKASLDGLINSGAASWSGRMVDYRGERFFFTECHLLYLLDNAAAALPGGGKTIWDAAFEYGSWAGKKSPSKKPGFLADFFSACGFGDVFIERGGEKVSFKWFPWTPLSKKSGYSMLGGFLSGFLSASTGKKTAFGKPVATQSSDGLDLEFRAQW